MKKRGTPIDGYIAALREELQYLTDLCERIRSAVIEGIASKKSHLDFILFETRQAILDAVKTEKGAEYRDALEPMLLDLKILRQFLAQNWGEPPEQAEFFLEADDVYGRMKKWLTDFSAIDQRIELVTLFLKYFESSESTSSVPS